MKCIGFFFEVNLHRKHNVTVDNPNWILNSMKLCYAKLEIIPDLYIVCRLN